MVSKLDKPKVVILKATALKQWLFSLSAFEFAIFISLIIHAFSILFWANSSGNLTKGKSFETEFISSFGQTNVPLRVVLEKDDSNSNSDTDKNSSNLKVNDVLELGSVDKKPSDLKSSGGVDLGVPAPVVGGLGPGYRGFLRRQNNLHAHSSQPVLPPKCPTGELSSTQKNDSNCQDSKPNRKSSAKPQP
jgi:hypothetical protein